MKLLRSLFLLLSAACCAVPSLRADQTPLTRDALVESLTRDVSSHFNLEGDLQLEFVRAWTPPNRVASTWTISVLEYPALAASTMLLRCRVLADGETAAETTFVLRAALLREVWVARQPLTIGSTFDPSLLETRRVDLFRERDVLPTAVGDNSFVFARPVASGRVLTWRDVSRRPLVRKGELVEVSAVDGLLNVTMKALAMENGAQGDTVTVRNPESRKDFPATVINEKRVQVRF